MLSLLAPLVLVLPADVTLTKTDGEVLTGAWSIKTLTLEADYGTIEFDALKIGRLEFGDPDRVVLADGRDFEGELDLQRLRLETADGKVQLRASDVASIEFLVDGRPVLAEGFSGVWCTSFGPMRLVQQGNQVTGTYGHDDEFKLSGTVAQGVLSFKAQEPNGTSEGEFTLWEDGNTFQGDFRFNGGDERFWGAYRIDAFVPEPVPGEVVTGQSGSWQNFHLRVPKDYDPQKDYPAVAFFHGSNMNSRAYVDTIAAAWPDVAEDFILVGIDGENLSSRSQVDGERFYNFSYVNFSGHEVGQAWRYRQSPGLVADTLQELQEVLPISKWLVGGHSQGGFLTYAVMMYYPDLLAGAFPMSCNLLVQCEPDNTTDEDVRASQRAVALAPIHGQRDSVVDYSSGEYCHGRMVDGGFPTLRFFNPERVGHEFALLPVDEALRWLDAMTSGDALALLELAEAEVQAGRYRSATAAALRAEAAGATAAATLAIHDSVDAEAREQADRLTRAVLANENADWVDGFWEFRGEFAFTPAAARLMDAYGQLRAEHEDAADKAFYTARQMDDDDERNAKYTEIVERYYASKWYPLVKGWLND